MEGERGLEIMSSRDIATLTQRDHRLLKRDINRIEIEWEKANGSKFEISEYEDDNSNRLVEYLLNREELSYVSARLNKTSGERLNSINDLFKSYSDLIRAYADEVEKNERLVKLIEQEDNN